MHYQSKPQQLYAALRHADWDEFNRIRFNISEEGWVFRIKNQDLSGCNLEHCPAEFLSFHNCNLAGASLANTRFFPASFKNCNLQNADLRGAYGVVYFKNCDLRGVKYDEETEFVVPNSELPSEFGDCQFDPDFREYLAKQGVRFSLSRNSRGEF